jgi:hypothetical protein
MGKTPFFQSAYSKARNFASGPEKHRDVSAAFPVDRLDMPVFGVLWGFDGFIKSLPCAGEEPDHPR